MKKIKVYDIDALIGELYPDYKAFRYEKATIFEGPQGIVFAEQEAVHVRENLITDSVKIPLCQRPPEGYISLAPTADLTITLDEIVAGAPHEEMTIEEFFVRRDYNPRCQQNYATLMSSLRSIGFDLHGYFADSPSIDDQIQAAAGERDKAMLRPDMAQPDLAVREER